VIPHYFSASAMPAVYVFAIMAMPVLFRQLALSCLHVIHTVTGCVFFQPSGTNGTA